MNEPLSSKDSDLLRRRRMHTTIKVLSRPPQESDVEVYVYETGQPGPLLMLKFPKRATLCPDDWSLCVECGKLEHLDRLDCEQRCRECRNKEP